MSKVNLKLAGFVSHQSISKGQNLLKEIKIDVEFSSEECRQQFDE